ncbi:MAG: DUF350 domain-containing protein [Rhodospirillales bacterium]|nr:MAG: DUF350 domain-containing protein [Rhodospirillales bacterium]
MFDAVLASALKALPTFLTHFGATVAILILGVLVYTRITRHNETRLIDEGNVAAATAFGAAVLGMAVPLAICLARSVSVPDILVWGVVSLVVQIATFFAVDRIFRDLSRRIERGDMAAAVAVASTKLGVAAINAAAIAG